MEESQTLNNCDCVHIEQSKNSIIHKCYNLHILPSSDGLTSGTNLLITATVARAKRHFCTQVHCNTMMG